MGREPDVQRFAPGHDRIEPQFAARRVRVVRVGQDVDDAVGMRRADMLQTGQNHRLVAARTNDPPGVARDDQRPGPQAMIFFMTDAIKRASPLCPKTMPYADILHFPY